MGREHARIQNSYIKLGEWEFSFSYLRDLDHHRLYVEFKVVDVVVVIDSFKMWLSPSLYFIKEFCRRWKSLFSAIDTAELLCVSHSLSHKSGWKMLYHKRLAMWSPVFNPFSTSWSNFQKITSNRQLWDKLANLLVGYRKKEFAYIFFFSKHLREIFFCVYYFNLIPLCVHSLCGTTSLSLSRSCSHVSSIIYVIINVMSVLSFSRSLLFG